MSGTAADVDAGQASRAAAMLRLARTPRWLLLLGLLIALIAGAALLARDVGRRIGLEVRTDVVARVRRTPQQVGLGQSQRADNVRGAFAVAERHKADVADKAVIVVDDVFTTGATLDACATTLLGAGVGEVRVVVLARVW